MASTTGTGPQGQGRAASTAGWGEAESAVDFAS